MPDNYLIVGTGDIGFGTDSAGYTGIGVIISATRKDGGDKLEIKDRQGNVFIVVYFNAKNECEIEVLFDEETTIPERGDALSLCGLTNVLCDDIEHKWSAGAERKFTIRGTRYAHLTPGA